MPCQLCLLSVTMLLQSELATESAVTRRRRHRPQHDRLASPSSASRGLHRQCPPPSPPTPQLSSLPHQAGQLGSPSSASRARDRPSQPPRPQTQQPSSLPHPAGQRAGRSSARGLQSRARSVPLPLSRDLPVPHSPAPQMCPPSRTARPTRAIWTHLMQTRSASKPPRPCSLLLTSCNRARRVLLSLASAAWPHRSGLCVHPLLSVLGSLFWVCQE